MLKKPFFSKLVEHWPFEKRIELAKGKVERVLDHFLYLLALHENNAIVVYSDKLSSQIPESYAAHAFNTFQQGMHQFEIVRLCALWDTAELEKESIPTIVELIDHAQIIDMLARGAHPPTKIFSDDPEIAELHKAQELRFSNEMAARAAGDLKEAIESARDIISSPRLLAVVNMRDKYLAHSLSKTHREKERPVAPMKYGDETILLEASVPIMENLYRWLQGDFSISESREIDQENAEALWHECKFTVLR